LTASTVAVEAQPSGSILFDDIKVDAAAKSQASDFALRIAAISHQSMDAMGPTHEHILHHYTRRPLGAAARFRQRDLLERQDRSAPYAKVGPDAPWTSLSASKYAA